MRAKAVAKQIHFFRVDVQNCDGVYAASCPELDITCFGDKDTSAVQEVFDAVVTNARSVMLKRQRGTPLTLPEERTLAPLARKIASSSRIQDFFEVRKK
jgi:hypothetical protein